MFRISLRSVSDPIRHHVCRACLTPRLAHHARFPRFYSTSLPRATPAVESAPHDHVEAAAPGEPASTPENNVNSTASSQGQEPKPGLSEEQRITLRREKKSRRILDGWKLRPVRLAKNDSRRRQLDETSAGEPRPNETGAETGTKKSGGHEIYTERISGLVNPKSLALTPLDVETPPVPRLSYGLDRALFNPGVYHLRDPRSRVFNFDPYLGSIMPVSEFDYETLKEYITSSRDTVLRGIAEKEGKKYVGSSSSMTSVLSHFHYVLSAWRPVDTRTVSQGFTETLRSFTRLLRGPAAIFLRYKDGAYAIDADKEFDDVNVLQSLGKSMEKLLTLPKEEFERYRRSSANKVTPEEEQATPESYHYTTQGDFAMRSQLDAYDPRLPGTGMFDLKTRAVVSIRMDVKNFEKGVGYEVKGRFGDFESFEREYFDMIRAAFLKYSLQARIGRMDGIFVAYHNIQRIFGFQYINMQEMDQTIHGQSDTTLGDQEFKISIELWNKILDQATARFPQQSLRLHFEARENMTSTMLVFVEPVTDEQIHAIQTKNDEEIDRYNRRILNLQQEEDPDNTESPATAESEPLADNEVGPNNEEHQSNDAMAASGDPANEAGQPKDSAQKASASDGETNTSSTVYDTRDPPDQNFLLSLADEVKTPQPGENDSLIAFELVIKNKVNGEPVERPEKLTAKDEWTVEYDLTPIVGPHVHVLYRSCQNRRKLSLSGKKEEDSNDPNNAANTAYLRQLRKLSLQGREFRTREDKLDREHGVVVLGDERT